MHTIRLVMIPVGLALLASSNLAPALTQTAGKQFDDASLKDGKQIFRYDTFGSEDFWGGQVKLHQAIAGEKNGGVGPGLSPNKALELGLKVDLASVPKAIGPLIEAWDIELR